MPNAKIELLNLWHFSLFSMPAPRTLGLIFCILPTNESASIETALVRVRIFLRNQYENYYYFNNNFDGDNRNHFGSGWNLILRSVTLTLFSQPTQYVLGNV